MPAFVEVAVPLPLPGALTYEVPPGMEHLAVAGARARVQVGKRRLIGVITDTEAKPAPEIQIRPLLAVLDLEPVFPPDLLDLGREASSYYLAPIGEVLAAMVPSKLPPWGDRRIWLTDAGALARPRTDTEGALVEYLQERGRVPISELIAHLGAAAEAHRTIEVLASDGRVVVSDGRRLGARYQTAVELGAGEIDSLLSRCGRSRPGRQVVELLAALGRPATIEEVTETVGCTAAVVRRLVQLEVLRQFTQVGRLGLAHHRFEEPTREPITLRSDQAAAVEELFAAMDSGEYKGFLLAGVTGSGKTEVYLRAVAKALESGGSAIILVPEIALVPAIAGVASQRFDRQAAVFHSGMTAQERQQEWERIRQGEARVVLGPRSAILTPVSDLKLVVIDEEQDPAYKQDQVPRYNGRDLAVLRAHRCGAVALLASATPSLETRLNVEVGKMHCLTLTERVGQGALPEGILVDLRAEKASRRPGEIHFSTRLQMEVGEALGAGSQVIFLRNRRGYSPLILCRACGHDFRCAECGLPRTYHRREERLRCHYCGESKPIPDRCPECDEMALEAIGSGTERVEESVKMLWPQARIEVLDRDTTRRGEAAGVLQRFARGESQILVGTQMVSKGHHFPGVVLTGVLLADTYLSFPDFRAVEKTYNLLTQVAGRAGRGDRAGRVIIQTYHPQHYAIQAALGHADEEFAAEEMRFRRMFHYPPYTRMIQLLLRDTNRARAINTMQALSERLERHPAAEGIRIAGPAPAPFERLRGKWRYQILLRHRSGSRLRKVVEDSLREHKIRDLVVDVDPYELL